MTGICKKSAGALRAPAQSGVHLSPILVSFSVIFGVHFGVPFGTPIGAETQGKQMVLLFCGLRWGSVFDVLLGYIVDAFRIPFGGNFRTHLDPCKMQAFQAMFAERKL